MTFDSFAMDGRTDGRTGAGAWPWTVEVLSHNLYGVGIDEIGARCLWFPTLLLACLTRGSERHWASLSTEPLTECSSVEAALAAETGRWS